VKQVEKPISKSLNQWREELYGYWMVVTDMTNTDDGVRMATARYYGTDEDKLYDIWNELCLASEKPDVGIRYNKRDNWLGGAFLVKSES
jgi:hypothetical protein